MLSDNEARANERKRSALSAQQRNPTQRERYLKDLGGVFAMRRDGRPSPEIEAIERGNQPLVSTHWCFAVPVLELKHAIVAFEVLGGVKALARLAERDELIARADEAVKIAEQSQAPCENDDRKKIQRPRRALVLHARPSATSVLRRFTRRASRLPLPIRLLRPLRRTDTTGSALSA